MLNHSLTVNFSTKESKLLMSGTQLSKAKLSPAGKTSVVGRTHLLVKINKQKLKFQSFSSKHPIHTYKYNSLLSLVEKFTVKL